jgi:hypothetical protein
MEEARIAIEALTITKDTLLVITLHPDTEPSDMRAFGQGIERMLPNTPVIIAVYEAAIAFTAADDNWLNHHGLQRIPTE